jgi:murein DD-endopeptidase MepM/ murein hydrolase activator NlpD
MSYRPHSHPDHPTYPRDTARPLRQQPRLQHGATPATAANGSSYTIAHAGRQVRIGPVVFWIVVGTITTMGVWSAATASYFAFRDDVLTKLIARQASMQYAYEDRIAELRARLDRTTSRQLLDQEQFDRKLEQIARRQSALEQRASALNQLPDVAVTGSVRPAARPLGETSSGALPKPSPINDTVIFTAPPDREARLEPRAPAPLAAQPAQYAKASGLDSTLVRLQASLDQVEQRQIATLAAVEESYESKIRRMRGVFADLGLDLSQMEGAAARGGVGGPFVPVKPPRDADGFDRQIYRINITRAQVERLNRTLALVPYRKPVLGEVEFSSGFGIRSDPFLGRPAMHTGLDFRASMGDPVRATANGRVESAGWSGGYGRMIEIDHGNGLSTRYGHLSEIKVKVGDVIKIGQIIGAVGSTGRSTGPHLHYETRIEGEAVDPQKFLRAGVRLSAG